MKPLVSVLIPCYNAEKFLSDTIKSVLNQTWKNIELIIVDDGSKDRSYEIATSVADSRIKVIKQINKGASSARNHAYRECKGEFIQHLDADDLLSPDKIEEQVKLLLLNPPGFLAVTATIYFFNGEKKEDGILQDGWPLVDSDDPVEWLIEMLGPETGSMVQPASWLTPRSICEKIGPWNESIDPSPDVDGEYFARAVLASRGIRRSRNGINYYRKFRSGGSMSGQKSKMYQEGGLRSIDLISTALLGATNEVKAKKALSRRYKELAFSSYPYAPIVTKRALGRAMELGFGDFSPQYPTLKGNIIASLIGWKLTKWLNYILHKLK
jgi:glycosyltransferase involved in cell wall biosynthesis